MLNHFLRYLQAQTETNTDNWLAHPDEPLKGFSWRSGCNPDTTGILMWSKPFVVKTKNDQELAIFLMDTQGAFDSTHTIKQWSTVFALSILISSIQGLFSNVIVFFIFLKLFFIQYTISCTTSSKTILKY